MRYSVLGDGICPFRSPNEVTALEFGGPSQGRPSGTKVYLALGSFASRESGVQRHLELRSLLRDVPSSSLRFSHKQNANCTMFSSVPQGCEAEAGLDTRPAINCYNASGQRSLLLGSRFVPRETAPERRWCEMAPWGCFFSFQEFLDPHHTPKCTWRQMVALSMCLQWVL